MPFDHICLEVAADVHKKTVDFYIAALKPIGYEKLHTFGPNEAQVGFGVRPKPDFWVMSREASTNVHFAFSAPGR